LAIRHPFLFRGFWFGPEILRTEQGLAASARCELH
jgi:hypothetical protein